MATRRNNDGFERMQGLPSDSDTDVDEPRNKKLLSSSDKLCPKNHSFKRRDLICVAIGAVIVGVALLIVILVVALQSRGGSSSSGGSSDVSEVRLPSNIRPSLYDVDLTVDFESFTVTGRETILINVLSTTNKIVIHFKNMSITASSLSINGGLRSIGNTYAIEDHDFYVMEVDSMSTGDRVELSLDFTYPLKEGLAGFYLSTYKNEDGDTVNLATTQFEPTDARRAFPCFDEPAMKANFSISITHPSEYTATSNMPVKPSTSTRRSSTGMTTTQFETSYPMSTYLVAFVVSDFECSDPSIVNDHIKVRICASPVVFNSTSYAQEVTNDVIGYYESFFGVNYPLPKQDLFAIPDFAAGAMENWGLITYRETALLYDPSKNPLSSKQRVAVVIAHELAHQWFGNLVTMDWWDGLWLNEGFASYVEYIGTDHKEKSWKMLEQFYVQTIQTAYDADGLNYSHPILQDVSDPDEINSLFDSISYDKGASLIRMLLNHVGEAVFTKGLAKYLNEHKFGNADTSELWNTMDEVTTTTPNVSSTMDTWTKQMGYPVVMVTRKSSTELTYKQERFLLNPLPTGGQMAPSPYNYQWIIPFTYIVSTSPNKENKQILKDRQGSIALQDSLSTDAFVKANNHQNGFYRVNYDDPNWQAITNHLMSSSFDTVLSGVDRAGLIDDAFALSNGGFLNITKALELSLYLRNEREYVPWKAASVWIDRISRTVALSSVYGKYQRYVTYLINNTVNEYPLDKSDVTHLETFLKSLILQRAWQNGNNKVAQQLQDKFTTWMKDSTQSIEPDLKYIVYSAGIAMGGEEEWNFMWTRYLTITDPYEKQLTLAALSFSTEPWILNRYLQYALDGKIRTQDVDYVIRSVSVNVYGRQLAWNFFRDNYDFIYERFGGSSFSFSRLIKVLTRSFSTNWELYEVHSFFDNKKTGSATLAVQQAMETVSGNILWMNNNLETLSTWIDHNIPY